MAGGDENHGKQNQQLYKSRNNLHEDGIHIKAIPFLQHQRTFPSVNGNGSSSSSSFKASVNPHYSSSSKSMAKSPSSKLSNYTSTPVSSSRGNSLLVSLTCLQFGFAIYVTFLLLLISPSIDLIRHSTTTLPLRNSLLFARDVDRNSLQPPQQQRLLTAQPISHNGSFDSASASAAAAPDDNLQLCEHEVIDFEQKRSNDTKMQRLKTELFSEIMEFQKREHGGCETLKELMAMRSKWNGGVASAKPKVLAVINHYKRRTLCAQLEALLNQTIPVHSIWVVAFGSPKEAKLRRIAESYNDSRISFISSTYDFKYYGRFQVALQAEGVDYVYILDDDMIPGRKMVNILTHVAGTEKYGNAVLGSIGRILPFRQPDLSFPSYRKYGVKEAGLYIPDPAYGINVDRIMRVDFLCSSWFLSAEMVKTLFVERPFTFTTGEDLHLSYQLQKYRRSASYVVPVNPADKESWGDSEHRLAQISETTVIFKHVVETRDDQWWRVLNKGYVTQWAAMNPQESDAIFYAHTAADVRLLAPLLNKYKERKGKKAFLAVAGGESCPCDAAVRILGWNAAACRERRFRVFDLSLGADHISVFQELLAAVKGLLRIHNPALLVAVSTTPKAVVDALSLAAARHGGAAAATSFVLLPPTSVPHCLWIPDVELKALRNWKRMRISINVITQNRAYSLRRLLASLREAHYVGDEVTLTLNMDSKADEETVKEAAALEWAQGAKVVRRRIIQGGLIRAVSESWYPAHDHDYGLLLEDDIEVSPFFYMWLKACLLHYRYTPSTNAAYLRRTLSSIALYSPRIVEVVKERPKWNATSFFNGNTPYLHQLPCSWGALFFPKHWREFYVYMGSRFTEDAKSNSVQIPKSRTNGWQASWKKFLIDMMYLRGYVALYPNFPDQHSFSTNHMEPGAHISAAGNVVRHNREDFVVPLLKRPDFWSLLPDGRLPPAERLPVIDLFNSQASLKELKLKGASLAQDVLQCPANEVVYVDEDTGIPRGCMP